MLVADGVVVVGVEAGLLHVEGLGAIHVGHGNGHELELPVHDRLLPGRENVVSTLERTRLPLAFGIIRDELDAGSVARGTAWMSAILGAGGVLGIVLARPDPRAPLVPLAVLDPARRDASRATAAAYWVVPRRPAAHAGGVNWLSAALLAGWLVCLLLGVSEGPA